MTRKKPSKSRVRSPPKLPAAENQVLNYLVSLPGAQDEVSPEVLDQIFGSLGEILRQHPQLWPFSRHFFSSARSPLDRLLVGGVPPTKVARLDPPSTPADSAFPILSCCYWLVRAHPHFFHALWDWSALFPLLNSSNISPASKFLVTQILGEVFALNDLTRQRLFLGAHDKSSSPSRDQYHDLSLDLLLPSKKNPSKISLDVVSAKSGIAESRLITVESIPLLRLNLKSELTPSGNERDLILTDSLRRKLRDLALSVLRETPVLLTGPVGSGKTSLIEHLAKVSGHQEHVDFHRIQVSTHTDGRCLLGNYVCSDVPGNFTWKAGVLTKAVQAGHWVLIEDVDKAQSDVISVLLPLIQSGKLHIPSKGMIPAKPGFQLFFTQRKSDGRFALGAEEMVFGQYTASEQEQILTELFPDLRTVLQKLIVVLMESKTSSRPYSIRDLIFWCQRCVRHQKAAANGLDRDILFLEGLHVFCNHLSNLNEKWRIASQIGHAFQITDEKITHYLEEWTPSFIRTSRKLTVNNISYDVPDVEGDSGGENSGFPFCITKQTARLLEFLTSSILLKQPVLMVGETGVGKTTTVQYMGNIFRKKVHVINMCEQTESADLFGGFKPVDIGFALRPLVEEFQEMCSKCFSEKKNKAFFGDIFNMLHNKQWTHLLALIIKVAVLGRDKKNASPKTIQVWSAMIGKFKKIETNLKAKATNMFAYVNGILAKAMQAGDWVLLDEINMAEAEMLHSLTSVLTNSDSMVINDENETIVSRSPDFRLFACMNPSTDIGKKDLPEGLRNRFVEYYLQEPKDKKDLQVIVSNYLEKLNVEERTVSNIVNFYLKIKSVCKTQLCDGVGHKPSFSLRTLCRALGIASRNKCKNVSRSLFEAFSICFLTELDRESYPLVLGLIYKYIHNNEKLSVSHGLTLGGDSKRSSSVNVEGYWIDCGPLEPLVREDYILTDTVRQNLKDVARIVSLSDFPILIQGETSVGKTSLVHYLAQVSGNRCLRINNHEHTDIQEYVGSYCTSTDGSFYFKEGVLAEAMRHGHWIILDELNLASSEILEALNRVLDDNRELLISETQTVIKAHKSFRIFATQNPVGSYGGRKALSRAFRNRFVELHFGLLQLKELETIIEKKCQIPKTISKKIIRVMAMLQIKRRASEMFQGKHGFITLRDLFRWAMRYSKFKPDTQFYDWDQHVAEEGYLVLSSRIRKPDELGTILESLEKVFKKKINTEELFSRDKSLALKQEMEYISKMTSVKTNMVWTSNALRMTALLLHSFRFGEPVLFVGETGGGKTSVCQAVSDFLSQTLFTVNCHLNTDASDFLGSLRPCRDEDTGQLFEWANGPMVDAMEQGGVMLIDEISLADDSVVERLNSVLEEGCKLVLPEKPNLTDANIILEIAAHEKFRVCATMNPSGDFGKKELSPALRNRFLEIWCPSTTAKDDIRAIVIAKLERTDVSKETIDVMVEFIDWIRETVMVDGIVSVRDVIAWCEFIRNAGDKLPLVCSVIHGTSLVFLDGLQCYDLTEEKVVEIKCQAEQFLRRKFNSHSSCSCFEWLSSSGQCQVSFDEGHFQVGAFKLKSATAASEMQDYLFSTKSVTDNAFRVLRGLQSDKPLLLEGPPGAGKSVLVNALARVTGNKLVRINLSDQTDLNDLFGSDLPSKDEAIGSFSWHDGPVLTALKQGSWILFDELNLATQSVLEGLNACLDHRGEIFIAELNKTFSVKNQTTKVFATQNPSKDGSGRKSLPKSFLNRFSKVYVKSLDQTDIVAICHHRFSNIPVETISVMSKILEQLENDLSKERKIGFAGAPWQMNLRDLMRWCEGVSKHYAKKGTGSALNSEAIVRLGKLVLAERFRTQSDQCHVMNLLESTFQCQAPKITIWYANEQSLKVGSAVLSRSISSLSCGTDYILLQEQIPILESLMLCADNRWIPILVGDSGAGKTALVECLAQLAGQNLQCITLSASSDTSDLLGSFEQSDIWQRVHYLCQLLQDVLGSLINDEACDLSLIVGILQFVASVGTSDLPLSTIVLRLKEEFAKLETTAFGQCQILDPIRKEFRALDNLSLDSNMVIFKWIDSVLVNAVQTGKWIVIDNANFCCASVLDRLNGLFEPGGVLSIGEQGCTEGDVRTVKPHENFRIFLTMNQKFGELSPAMRNRGVEIFVDESYSDESLLQICQSQCPNLTPEQIVRVTQERLTQQGRTNLQKPSLRELKSLFSALRLESQLSGVIGGITHNHRTIQTISEMSLRPLASQAVAQVQILFKFLQKDQQKYGLAGVQCFLKLATNVDVGMRKRLLNDVFNLNTQVLEDLLSIMRKALKNNTPLDAHLLRVEKDLDADSKTSDKILLAMFQKLADMQIPADSASVDFDVRNIQEGFKDSLPDVMSSAFSTDFDYIETWRLIHAVTWFKAKIFSLPSSVDTIEAAIRLGWIVLKEHFENSTLWNNCFFGQHAAVLSCTLISQSMAMIHSGFEGEPPLTSLAQVEAFKALLEASYKLRPSAIKDIAVLQPTLKALANYNNDPSNINLEIALAEKCDTKKAELFLNQILLKDLVISFFNSLRSDPRDMKHSELHDLRFRELVANAKNNNRLSSLLLAVQKQLHQIQTPVMIQLLQKSSSSEDVEMSDPSLANRTTMSVSSLMAPVFLADSKCSLFHQEISMKLLRKAREILVSSYLVSKRYLEQKSELALNNAEEDFEKIIRAFRDQIANATSISDEDFKNNLVKLFRREKSIPDGIASLLESCFRLKEELLSLKALPSNRRKTAIVINVKSRLQIASSLILFWMVTDECSSDIREKADAKLDLLRTETSNSVSVLQTERSCVTLSYYTGSEGLAHHSHHQALSKVVNDNVNLERKIEADLPIRGEPQKQLEAELSVMQKGLFSPAYVQTLVEEIKSHKNVEYIMKRVTNWTHSLTKFMDDVALNFPSFVDMWSLSSYAMVEAIKGVEVLLGESNAEREGGIKIEIMDHITTAREQKQRLVLYHAIEVDGTIVAAGQEGSAESLETSGQSLTVLHRLSDEISFSQQPTEDEESNPSPIGHFFRQLGSKSVGLQIEPKETLNLYLNILAKISGSHYVDPKVEISFLSSHVRAIDQTLNELTKRDAEMDDLNEIVMHLLTLKSRVNEDLLSQWPENQLLIDIVRGIDEIGGHSVHDSRAEFLVAFETLGEKIAEWNKGAPSHLAVDRTRIAKQVETWKLKEYKDTSKTFERLRSNLLKDTLKAGFKLFKIVDSIRISKRNVDKRRYVVTTLGLFISSANLVDFEARLQIVQAMAEYFRLCDRPISRNIQEVAAYFEQYLAQFKEIFKNCKAGIAKNVTTVMKSFNQKDLRSYKQFINQKKKLGGDSAETMSAKVSKLNSEHDVKSRLTQPEPLLIALEDCQIQFRDGLDNLMGDTKQMLAKADVSVKNLKNRFSALSEEKAGELEELRVTLERSTDKYLCTKMVEGLMKDLKGEGLSFRIGNMTNVSARNLLTTATKESRESLSVLNACLSETDLLRSILTDPKARKNHISARFPPQALGLTSHGLVKVFKANFDFSREALEASQFDCLVERLKAFATIDGKVSKEQKIHDRILEQSIGEIIFVLKEQLNSNGLSSSVKHSIESTISNLAELCSKLEKNLCSSLAIKDEIQKLEKISLEKFCESHNLAEVRSATKNILSRLQRSVKSEEEKAKKVSVSSEATEKMEVFAKKCLLSVQELKRAIDNLKKQKELKDEQDIDENAEDDSVFKALEICRDLFKAFHSSSRTRELGNIVRYLEFCSDSGLNLGSSKSYALEILAVCSMFQCVFFWLLKTLQTTGVIAQKYLYTIIKIFIAYIGKEFSQNDQPESKEGDQEDQKDGCGLGEGKGDKATLDGVEDEDLFENEPKEGKEEEEEEKEENDKDEEQDPAVDFSQDMGGTNKDEDPKDEDASDDEEDERDKDDIENVERDEINNEQEEELRPDDWDEEEDDGAEENEDEKEKKEDEEKERHAPDTTGQEDEQCSDNDIDAEEEEPRTRHPDEVDEEAIDDHMEDEQYGQEPEIECEDMDLPEDMNMGDEDEEEVVMEDEKLDDKLPDFVDEEQEESIQERDQNLITESQMGAGTNELAEANMDDDNDGTPEDKDKEVKSSKKDDDRSASQPGEDDKKDEDMEGDDKEEKEDQQQEFQLENEKDVKDDVQKRDVLNESDRPEDKDSKDFSHVNPNESSEETTSAIDDIKNLPDDLKQKIEVKMNEDEKTEEETKPQGQSEKKTLEQELFKKLELKDTVKTDWVSRGDESIFASLPDDSMNGVPVDDEDMELDPPVPDQDLPQQPEKDAIEQWLLLCAKTSDSSHYLTEQLRMLIEPTKASRLKGDYRTGKRINMRKIIPYIASHYKKDKIWLRRTKPSRRECEIVIAIDDSSSMADNDVQGITKEALSMICQALSVLEIGKLGIVTYGEDAKVVQPLSASVSSKDGAKILSQITFGQSVTKLLNLMSLTKRMFSTGSGHPLSKLMLIISDGKGVLNEGKSAVLQSVRDFRMQNIFVVFLIVEAKEKTESVLDIRIPIFDDKNNLKGIDSYMDHFPFPYYIILKEIRTLPSVLSDALKQWFEMVNK